MILNSSIWPEKMGPNKYYHSDQSGPGSNGNEGAFHIPQCSKTGASPSDTV